MIPGTHLEKLAREEEKEGEDDVGPVTFDKDYSGL